MIPNKDLDDERRINSPSTQEDNKGVSKTSTQIMYIMQAVGEVHNVISMQHGLAAQDLSLLSTHDLLMHTLSNLSSEGGLLRPVPLETERPLGAGRLGLSHWAVPSVTGSAGWSEKWYGGIIVDILAKESKFP